MRVICVKKPTEYSGSRPYWYSPEVGDKLEVTKSLKVYGRIFYDFAEYPEFLYDSCHFATLPDQTSELVTEAFEEKYYVPVNQ